MCEQQTNPGGEQLHKELWNDKLCRIDAGSGHVCKAEEGGIPVGMATDDNAAGGFGDKSKCADYRSTAPKIGVIGGSFDPVHIGHVNLARDALTQAKLDRVLFVPARMQPFKLDRTPASGEDRMEMLRLALAEDPQIEPCAYELEHDNVSYTYLTLHGLQEQLGPEVKLYFIIGADSLLKLETWMHADELMSKYAYIVGSRPGYLDQELEDCRAYLQETYGTEILWIHNREFNISATEIRRRIASGEPVSDLIPAPVEEYIKAHGLYR